MIFIRVMYTLSKTQALFRGYPPMLANLVMGFCVVAWCVLDEVMTYWKITWLVIILLTLLGKTLAVLRRLGMYRLCAGVLCGSLFTAAVFEIAHTFQSRFLHWVARKDCKHQHANCDPSFAHIEDTYVCTFMKATIWDFTGIDHVTTFVDKMAGAYVGCVLLFTAISLLVAGFIAGGTRTCMRKQLLLSPARLLLSWMQNPDYYSVGVRLNLGTIGDNLWVSICDPVGAQWVQFFLGLMSKERAVHFEKNTGISLG